MKKRKFHAYLYEYENAEKRQNCGYIKAELDEEKETYAIYLSTEKRVREVYLLQTLENKQYFQKIKELSDTSFLRRKISVSQSDLSENSPIALKESLSCGLVLITGNDTFIATIWEDILPDWALLKSDSTHLHEADDTLIQAQSVEEISYFYLTPSDESPKPHSSLSDSSSLSKDSNCPEASNYFETSNPSEALNYSETLNSFGTLNPSETLNQSEALTSSKTLNQSEALTSSKTLNQSEALTSSKTLNQSEALTSSKTLNQSETSNPSKTLNQSEVLTSSETLNPSETLNHSEPLTSSETSNFSKTLNQPKTLDQSETLNQPKTLNHPKTLNQSETLNQPKTLNQSETLNQSNSSNTSKIQDRIPDKKSSHVQNTFFSKDFLSTPDKSISKASNLMTGMSQSFHHNLSEQPIWKIEHQKNTWKTMTASFPIVCPFEWNTELQAVRLQLKNLRLLDQREWKLANNAFLLHGYIQYRYFIYSEFEENGNWKKIIGVPGHFDCNENDMAQLFGFQRFMPQKMERNMTGKFGFWVYEIPPAASYEFHMPAY